MSLNKKLLKDAEKQARKTPSKKKTGNSTESYLDAYLAKLGQQQFEYGGEIEIAQDGKGNVWTPQQLNWMRKSIAQFQNTPSYVTPVPQASGDISNRVPRKNVLKTREEAEAEAKAQILNRRPVNRETVRSHESRSLPARALAIMANPATAASYIVKGQDIPEYFDRGERNSLEMATSILNPFGYMEAAKDTYNDLQEGNYLSAGMSGLSLLPGGFKAGKYMAPNKYFRNALKHIAQTEGFTTNEGLKQLGELGFYYGVDKLAPIAAKVPGLRKPYKDAAFHLAGSTGGAAGLNQQDIKELLKNYFKGKLPEKNYRGQVAGLRMADYPEDRDLLKMYIYGEKYAPSFEKINDYVPIGLDKYTERYGKLSAYKMLSRVPESQSVQYHIKDIPDFAKKNPNRRKTDFPVELGNIVPNQASPLDDVAGHMGFVQKPKGKPWQFVSQDLWKFTPEDYAEKWRGYGTPLTQYGRYAQARALEASGKPFILTQTNPLKFNKGTRMNPTDNPNYNPAFWDDSPDISTVEMMDHLQNFKLIEKALGGQTDNVYVGQSKIQGQGLFASRGFRKGEVIGLAHENDQPVSVIGKYHNHSARPSAVSVRQGNQRYLVADKDIPAGSEITTNYFNQPELEQPQAGWKMQKGGSYLTDEEYDKVHPPIYVNDPKDPRIGQYHEKGNQYRYHPISKKVVSLFVDNPNDPRLRAYNDSMTLYKSSADIAAQLKRASENGLSFEEWDKINKSQMDERIVEKAYNNLTRLNGKTPKPLSTESYKGVDINGSKQHDFATEVYMYKKPVQSVIYQKPEPRVPATVPSAGKRSFPVPDVNMQVPTLEQQRTGYSYTYPTFDERKQATVYFPDENTWRQFTDKFGYSSRQVQPGYATATGTLQFDSGGEMIRRADGSYSRRGLWDNIRANKGSGKKPTREMLEQERKIRAEEKAYGGMVYPMFKNGGNQDREMVEGVADILSRVWDEKNRRELARYMMGQFKREEVSYIPSQFIKEAGLEQMREGGIPERYRNMGFSRVGQKKDSNRDGKKWMVLAKKGDQYKVVHGGYTGMKDYTQHHDENRRERFWDRMGGRDSAKAKDPFSPLYWHKRFGTWATGGEV